MPGRQLLAPVHNPPQLLSLIDVVAAAPAHPRVRDTRAQTLTDILRLGVFRLVQGYSSRVSMKETLLRLGYSEAKIDFTEAGRQ